MLLAVSFIEIGGKQKITIASIFDKKETLYNFSLIVKTDIKGRSRSRAVTLRIILAFHMALIYYTQDFGVYEETPIFWGKGPGVEVVRFLQLAILSNTTASAHERKRWCIKKLENVQGSLVLLCHYRWT